MPDTRHVTDRGLSLLGGWHLVVDGQDVALGGREQRLCALLALTGARGRAQVAGTLWPESTDTRALASLRRALAQTRDRCPGLVVADRTSVGLAPDVVVDVDGLRTAAARAGAPDADAGLLAELAGDPLLPGWYDEWVETQRDDLERLRVDALERLARCALERGDTGLAEGAARAVARIEPWRESASELVIRGLLGRGDRAGAVRELERYSEVLRVELGVVPSPALLALVDTRESAPVQPVQPSQPARPEPAPVPVVVPAQRRAPAQEAVEPLVRRAGPTRQPPPPPDPTPPTGPGGLTARAAAARLAAGAVLVMAASLAVANLGPGSDPASPSAVPDAAPPERAAGAELVEAVRQVLVRPVAAADGAAAFVVRATRRPARVRVEVADRSGSSVVRTVVVRTRDGQRVVVAGLDGGTYEWSATSPTAPPVTGEVRVVEQAPAVVVAAQEPSVTVTSSPDPGPSPTPSATPSQQPSATPSQQPTQQPTATPSPQPSPTRPGPPSGPTDPATQDPGLVG